jgi:phosphoserine phosphatase RsbX
MNAVVDGGHIERHGARVSWGMASSPLAPEDRSGDLCAVWSPSDGALIAVVDGAGHGEEAAVAAQIAADVMSPFAHESPVALVLRCHEHLRGTRGAAMTLASLNLLDRTMTWLGIGNVEAVLCRGAALEGHDSERVLLRSGVVGYRLKAHDILIMATDGVRPEFAEDAALAGDPKAIAARLLAQYDSHRDDALVVVAKFQEGGDR